MNALLQQRYHINGNRPALALAPMAGVSDLPFRQICEQLGADYSVTEMAATAPQLLQSDKNQARAMMPLKWLMQQKVMQNLGQIL